MIIVLLSINMFVIIIVLLTGAHIGSCRQLYYYEIIYIPSGCLMSYKIYIILYKKGDSCQSSNKFAQVLLA